MPSTENLTTLVCLFHTHQHALDALSDLQESGLPPSSLSVFGAEGASSNAQQSTAALKGLNLSSSDFQMLSEGLRDGGTVVVISAPDQFADRAEAIFEKHRAAKVDERVLDTTAPAAASGAVNGVVIPIVEEELTVGKRQVQRGGVRVFSRIVETPVEESITLRQEHAKVERTPVNRAVTEADMDALRVQSIEVTEMEEVPVVNKSARVVEEVLVGKDSSERTEHVTDTVRKTKVDVEPVATPSKTKPNPQSTAK